MAQISYTNKVALNENPEIADINKVTDDDMNEIKQVVNDNYNNTIQITDTEPTDSDNKIWIDTGEVSASASEITNEYSESVGLGYSANYINNLHTYSTEETRCGTYMGKPLYRKIFTGSLGTGGRDVVNTDLSNNYIITKIEGGFYFENQKDQFRPVNLFYIYQNVNYYLSVFTLGNYLGSVNHTLQFWYNTAFAGYPYEICLYYTKN